MLEAVNRKTIVLNRFTQRRQRGHKLQNRLGRWRPQRGSGNVGIVYENSESESDWGQSLCVNS